jgi:hypothetical protein
MYAGAMAAAASGTPVGSLFDRFIFDAVPMPSTFWGSAGGRPLLGSGISTTPEDYGAFLNAYFNGRLVSLATRADMERSHYPDATLSGKTPLVRGRALAWLGIYVGWVV